MDRNHIPVMPMLGGKKHKSNTNKSSNPDPDVNAILKQQNNDAFNVLKMDHEPTNEEKKSKSSKSSKSTKGEEEEKEIKKETNDDKVIGYSWLVLTLAVIVITLIIFIVWWVLGENRETNKPVIPPGIIRPHNIPPVHRGMPGHSVFKTQSEQMPIQVQNMPRPTTHTKIRPSKKELESVLSQINIETIPEEKAAKSAKPKEEKEVTIEVVDNVAPEVPAEVASTEAVMDDALVASFNDKLQSDIDNDVSEE
jgi:hypothetical protein